jgi:hypothetical protein
MQIAGGEGARVLHQLQARFELRAGGGIGQHLIDRAARAHQAPLALRRLRQIGHAAARDVTAQQQRQQDLERSRRAAAALG